MIYFLGGSSVTLLEALIMKDNVNDVIDKDDEAEDQQNQSMIWAVKSGMIVTW